MQSTSFALCLVAGLALSGTPTLAQNTTAKSSDGPWLVRLRMLSMSNANETTPFTAAGINFPANAIHVSDKVFPEVDFSYFVTRHWAVELVLTYPQDHAVSVAGVGHIGTIRHLPPILSVQYHYPIPRSRFTPYVGAGVNFTWVTSVNLNAANIPLDATRTSVGFAVQAGVDYDLGKHFSLNLDYKHMNLNPDIKVKATGAKLANAGVNPDLLSLGLGYRF